MKWICYHACNSYLKTKFELFYGVTFDSWYPFEENGIEGIVDVEFSGLLEQAFGLLVADKIIAEYNLSSKQNRISAILHHA